MRMGKISSIYILKNVNLKNEFNGIILEKQRVVVIEDFNGNRIILDDINGVDITESSLKVQLVKGKSDIKRFYVSSDLR